MYTGGYFFRGHSVGYTVYKATASGVFLNNYYWRQLTPTVLEINAAE